jgi:hypothetical protein
MFAGVTMRQQNVFCFKYGLLGNVDRGCDFHRIMAVQRSTMSAINAMITQASTSGIPETDIREPPSFADGRVVLKLHRWELTETQGFIACTWIGGIS